MNRVHRGIDVSAYQVNVPWKQLKENGVCDCAIIKGDQLTATANHVASAREAGLPVGLYFWNDPIVSISTQLAWFKDDIVTYQPEFVILDVEQYWAVWQDYWDYIYGKIPGSSVRRLSPDGISANAKGVMDGLNAIYPGKVMLYTAAWFINSYAAPISKWINNYPLWVANYFDYGKTKYSVTYDYIKSVPPLTFKPTLPTGATDCTLWQYSSRMIYPGMTSQYDSNIGDLSKWITAENNSVSLDEWAKNLDKWARGMGFNGPTLQE